jgi:hypothetical protein
MLYNGLPEHPWSRMCTGDGSMSLEYTISASTEIKSDHPAILQDPAWYQVPILHPQTQPWVEQDGVHFLGRFARWDHSRAHDAYLQTHSLLEGAPAQSSRLMQANGLSSA